MQFAIFAYRHLPQPWFEGQAEMLSTAFALNGAPMTALQGSYELDSRQHLLPLAAGGVLRVRAASAALVHITGGVEMSLWSREADVDMRFV
jgi:hypothetical protein